MNLSLSQLSAGDTFFERSNGEVIKMVCVTSPRHYDCPTVGRQWEWHARRWHSRCDFESDDIDSKLYLITEGSTDSPNIMVAMICCDHQSTNQQQSCQEQ